MPVPTLVNKFGLVSGWNQVQVVLYGRTIEGIMSFSYDDSMEKESIGGAGPMPIGFGEGEYKAKCGIELLSEEWYGILNSAPPGTRPHELPVTDVTVLTLRAGVMTKDIVRNFSILGGAKELKRGDKGIWMKPPVFCSHIDWNAQ